MWSFDFSWILSWRDLTAHNGRHVRSFLRIHEINFHVCPFSTSQFFFFFFLHCRTSARHCRSTTGKSEDRKQISRKAKANKNKTPKKQRPQNQTRQRSREICKKGETGETSASLSSPSQVLFRQVVLPHIVHV